jgi:hypothetical protein
MALDDKPPRIYNGNRRIAALTTEQTEQMAERAKTVSYGGKSKHKKNPGDFGLLPPATHNGGDPERGADALCDIAGIFQRNKAQALLKRAFCEGFVDCRPGRWPKTVWLVTEDGHVFEAELENPHNGTYHGYPLPNADPMRAKVLKAQKLLIAQRKGSNG